MKRLFIGLAAFACSIALSSFSTKPASVPRTFYRQFHGATRVNWSDVDGMLRVAFYLNGQNQYAFYSGDELLVVATEIETQQLPATLRHDLHNYAGYTITQAYVLQSSGVKQYYVVLDNDTTHLTLQGKKHWKVFRKEKK